MPSETVPVQLDEWPYEKDALRERLLTLLESVHSEGKLNLSRLKWVTVPGNLRGALRTFNARYESDHAAAMRESVAGRRITTLRVGRSEITSFSVWMPHFSSLTRVHHFIAHTPTWLSTSVRTCTILTGVSRRCPER
jgi:hypothetical protein